MIGMSQEEIIKVLKENPAEVFSAEDLKILCNQGSSIFENLRRLCRNGDIKFRVRPIKGKSRYKLVYYYKEEGR